VTGEFQLALQEMPKGAADIAFDHEEKNVTLFSARANGGKNTFRS